ncbi:MAG: FAD-dependent oxidoreductase [Candidatus Aenigmarchaeota archaeon]|nr:FAD-dependent oxidoreductase [Candidatus Aenigmarchaeota archaeon]
MDEKIYDLIIVGSGPAGLSASIYSSRYKINFIVIGKDMGVIADAVEVDNYMGFPAISGLELAKKFTDHAEKLGVKIVREEVKSIKKDGEIFVVDTYNNSYKTKTIIYALGGQKRKLGLSEEEKFVGKGISYCAVCDAAFYKDKVVMVAGGGNSAVSSATYLSRLAKKVYVVHRRDKFRAFPHLVKKMTERGNVEIIFDSVIVGVRGKEKVESVIVENVKTKDRKELSVDGIFVEFGYDPNSYLAEDIGVELTEEGRIKVNEDMSTNVRGFFAAGDVTNGSNQLNQLITAASEGAIAASSVYKFLKGGGG